MSKLANKAKSSKLRQHPPSEQNEATQPKVDLIRKIKPKEYPRSYRLDAEIMNILKNTLDRVNEASYKKVSEARLVKALIFLSQSMDEKVLLNGLKEVW